MFNRIFKKKSKGLSKIEYWKKWKLFELFSDLHLAEKMLSEFKGGYSGKFSSAEEFYNAFVEHLYEIEKDNVADFTQIWYWFAPTCEWDDFTGKQGEKLGNRIFERVNNWKKNHDFVHGTKVSLDGEFGVVIKSELDEPNFCGIIRWDSNKESDNEDWRGMFGTFINQGGLIIDQNHQFEFINDDGTLKKLNE
ncbi:hypothetical protein [Dokdonia sp. 4H-3-7-5]|uniref:hypothetical protein n=1 Tax=Dokdonia sp. (strain 4H-3-7-5) TaxID=983548 RepID=UPI00020A6F8B|nr:hypothetical protein [Dokdonia sp. 4H-3-7-5]AEE20237.1 hypothetical protein Krodi_2259 [Dokdonia sp. 4H-3-7-5]